MLPSHARNMVALFMAAVVMHALVADATAQTAVQVPGTRVGLVAPAGFEPATQFTGFQQVETGAAIVIAEIPGPFQAVRAGMTKEALATRSLTLVSSEAVWIANREGLLIATVRDVNGAALRQWIGVFGDSQATVTVVAAFPESQMTRLGEPLRQAVLSAEWNPTAAVGVFDGLTFRVEETATLKVSARLVNTVLLTRDGKSGPVAPEDPLLVVGSSFGTVGVGDLEAFARARITQTARVKDVRDIRGEAVTVAGSPGYEIVAAARGDESGVDLALYQVIVLRGGAYYIVQGMVGAASAERDIAEFRAITKTLSFVP